MRIVKASKSKGQMELHPKQNWHQWPVLLARWWPAEAGSRNPLAHAVVSTNVNVRRRTSKPVTEGWGTV